MVSDYAVEAGERVICWHGGVMGNKASHSAGLQGHECLIISVMQTNGGVISGYNL